MTSTQGMACVLGGIKPCPLGQLLYDPRNINTGQATGLNLPVAIDGAE
jgi:hypothetical protein